MPSFGNAYFYHGLLRRYVIAFGSMFDNLTVTRRESTGAVAQTLAIPIAYAPKESWLVRIKTDPQLLRTVQVQLPSASFELAGMTYDGTRKMQPLNKETASSSSDLNKGKMVYRGVPWNLNFSLFLYVRNADDGTQLLEQILPFFGPEWTNTMTLIPTIGTLIDVPVILNSVHQEDTYENNFIDRRALVWTLNFTMKAILYGPATTKGIIKTARTQLRDYETSAKTSLLVTTPGLNANGAATTHSNNSISTSLISADDPYGYCVDITDQTSGEI